MTFLPRCILLLALLLACGQTLADAETGYPERVGRIAYVKGNVTFQSAFGEERVPAVMNWPIASQNIVETGRDSRAEIRVGSTAVRIAQDTVIEIAELSEDRFLLYLTDGSMHVRVGEEDAEGDFSIRLPQGRIRPGRAAVVRIDADREAGAQVTVHQGNARFDDNHSSLTITAGKRVEIRDGSLRLSAAGNAGDDAFGAWSRERDRQASRAASQGYLPSDMTGAEELDRHGIWEQHVEYGTVWYPTAVAADWAPYRSGSWAWISPWGWTWIDKASWGYAPSHYGRWAHIDRRWGWIPGPVNVRHVWAPALVGWIGGRHWNAAFSFGHAPAVGWFPLGPYEPYVGHVHVTDHNRRHPNRARVADHPSQIRVLPHGSAGFATDGEGHRYQNRFVPNAVSVLPQERFQAGRERRIIPATGVVVAQPSQIRDAAVSSVAPIHGEGLPAVRHRGTALEERMHGRSGVVVSPRPPVSLDSGLARQGQAPSVWTTPDGGRIVSSGNAIRRSAPQTLPSGANQQFSQGYQVRPFERPSAVSSGGLSVGRSAGIVVQQPGRSGGAATAIPQGGGFSRPSGPAPRGGVVLTR